MSTHMAVEPQTEYEVTDSTDMITCPRCGSPAVRIPPAFASHRSRREYACMSRACAIRIYPDEPVRPVREREGTAQSG